MRYQITTDEFHKWVSREDVQTAARAFIISEGGERVEVALDKLDHITIGRVGVNFLVIEAVNILFDIFKGRIDNQYFGTPASLNLLACHPAPEWRKMLPIFAFAVGWRPVGDLFNPPGILRLRVIQ